MLEEGNPQNCQLTVTHDRDGGRPILVFNAGATAYMETFEHGRLLSQGWSCAGKLPSPAPADAMRDMPADSFRLIIDGCDLRRGWQWDRAEQLAEPHSVLHLKHDKFSVTARVHTIVEPSGFLTRWLEVENAGAQPLGITEAASFSGLLYRDLDKPDLLEGSSGFEIGRYLYRAWSTEGRFAWEPLPFGMLRLEGNRGTSGWGPPFFIIRRRDANELFIGGLAWSGNWAMDFGYDPFDRYNCLSFAAGPTGPQPLRVLAPGERITTPRMHLSFLHGDLDSAVQSFHQYLRRAVIPGNSCQPFPFVSYNHWGAFGQNFTEDQIIAEIDKAAQIGAEMFVLDAGWFGRVKRKYPANSGDWNPGEWLGGGIKSLSERAHSLGMKFGLWVAWCMIGNKSHIFEKHPDWVIRLEGRSYFADIVEEGHPSFSMSLDLTNPNAADWIEGELERIITSYDIDMLRLDGAVTSYEGGYNAVGDYQENTLWRQTENAYGILDRLRSRHPELLIDNCISGGGKLDYGMLARSDIGWISDDYHDSSSMLHSLNGVTLAIPPEVCTRTFGTILKDQSDIELGLRIPLFGQYCISGLREDWLDPSQAEYATIRRHIDIYKNFIRPFIRTCRVFHHTPVLDGPDRSHWCVWEYTSQDRTRALVGVFRLAKEAGNCRQFIPRGLNQQLRYRVTLDTAGTTLDESGSVLMSKGLSVCLSEGNSSELICLEAIDT